LIDEVVLPKVMPKGNIADDQWTLPRGIVTQEHAQRFGERSGSLTAPARNLPLRLRYDSLARWYT
jgi:hypothetical protein